MVVEFPTTDDPELLSARLLECQQWLGFWIAETGVGDKSQKLLILQSQLNVIFMLMPASSRCSLAQLDTVANPILDTHIVDLIPADTNFIREVMNIDVCGDDRAEERFQVALEKFREAQSRTQSLIIPALQWIGQMEPEHRNSSLAYAFRMLNTFFTGVSMVEEAEHLKPKNFQ